jgi:hypothetical protein
LGRLIGAAGMFVEPQQARRAFLGSRDDIRRRAGSNYVHRSRATLVVSALAVAACSGGADTADREAPPTPAPESTEVREYPDAIQRQLWRMASEPRPVENSAMPPRHLDAEAFPEVLVQRDRIVFGGRLPDQIPAIDEPQFAPAREIDWLDDDEAVLVLQARETVRAYPVQVMVWHEIVNDVVDGVPVAITYCPLCNSGIAFDRRVDGRALDFGTSGTLYQSALVMYDRQTESLWTHFDGRAVAGTLVGAELEPMFLSTVGWQDFVAAHPDAPVLTRDTGYRRSYGRNPYIGYDTIDKPLTGYYSGDVDDRLAPMARVVGIQAAAESVAVELSELRERGVVELAIDGQRVTIWHRPGLASSLDAAQVADGDDVGAVGAFFPETDAGPATFARDDAGNFVDDRTGSTWNILGEAVAGAAAGERLEPVTHVDTFWFAWSTYRPSTLLAE